MRVSGSVEEENVLGLKLKPCAPKAYHEGQCGCGWECGGRKCPRTQTQTHTGFSRSHWFYLNVAGPRTCAPKAYHEGQSVGVGGSVEEENVLGLKLTLTLAYHARSHTHTSFSHSVSNSHWLITLTLVLPKSSRSKDLCAKGVPFRLWRTTV